ncbi:mechanosensitive ion channel family protein [Desulfosediminicola flagellatus]|uniref:mechanosensitive ion channel family protein n=1 Tax=Desulfosediminicola flagellatus TaxID=2569541 RepID=UPI0010AD73C1|nr:mechanosensitive ion channel domain-containing protein [Desulfosediminicola flagellatus]
MGYLIEIIFKHFVFKRISTGSVNGNLPSVLSGLDKFSASLVKQLPHAIGLLLFFGGAYLAYFSFIWTDSPFVQLFFLAVLIGITFIRVIALISRIIFSPKNMLFRLLPMQCNIATGVHRLIVWSTSYMAMVLMLSVITIRLGAQTNTVSLLLLFFATILLTITGAIIIFYRSLIKDQIVSAVEIYGETASWGRTTFASIWHLLALSYLFALWLLLFNNLIDPEQKHRGAFMLSFFVLPIWIVTDKLLQWLIKYAMETLKIHTDDYNDQDVPTEEEQEQRDKGRQTFRKVMAFSRSGLVLALFVWVASLWNIKIPVFSNLTSVLFDSLIILAVALIFWQFISSWIERKIQESIPAEEENKDEDDEWGSAATRGRSYTLLPMIRRFIGTILVTMVTMTILSSTGVDIGPLLAGAGVIGLAVGFGAQKLVADMFSGFFYLLDDAFRVGEYVEAGGISGTVENISLRNVMLRHHRGMLQIVPHSELGAITNYMRGGIVVKFNLDFPYDAEIDTIRKIIKKVGQAMLADEEFGADFIRPVKSQGVREITNSVMTIRVKFTAKPGAHFVIRREAYKRITEALRAKGIHYAHRKVIVDIPEQTTENTKDHIIKAAGAAGHNALDAEASQNSAPADSQKGFDG